MLGRAFIVLVAALGVACGPDDRDLAYYEREPDPDGEPEPLQSAAIDSDRTVPTDDLGERVAAFVEYERGGNWFVGVMCDTASSEYGCDWDIIIQTAQGDPLFRVLEHDLERSDFVLVDVAAARLVAFTSDDLDGFSFRVKEDSAVFVDVFLDGRPHPEFLQWFGDGALHLGAPGNPFELVPSTP